MAREISLELLWQHARLSRIRCDEFVEACKVCLEQQGHQPGVELQVAGFAKEFFRLVWQTPLPNEAYRSWADSEEATEEGACAIAFWVLLKIQRLTVIRRSRKSTGFDYWLVQVDDELFQDAARLEISGIRHGTDAAIRTRVKNKSYQTQQSDWVLSHLPAYVVVVEFSKPMCFVEIRHDDPE